MNLEEYKEYILNQRKQATLEAVSVLSATISTTQKKGGN